MQPTTMSMIEPSAAATGQPMLPMSMVVASGCLTAVILSALFMVKKESFKRKAEIAKAAAPAAMPERAAAIDKEKYPGGAITVYYATQTGTAEAFAQELEREAPDHGFLIKIVDAEDVEELESFLKNPDETGTARAIVLAATYGEGEPTDNATALVHTMKDAVEEHKENGNDDTGLLRKLDYCVFGLGNKQYDQYNAMGKFFDEHLDLLGAKRIMPLGMGDDDDDLEGDFESWREKLWVQLKTKYHTESFEAAEKNELESLPECEYTIQYHQDKYVLEKQSTVDEARSSSKHYFTSFDCPVTKVRELRTPEDGGSTVHLEIDISEHKKNGLFYQTADNLGVLPVNDTDIVESVASSLGYDLDAIFSLKAASKHEWHGAPFPMPITVRECLARYIDLTSAPRRSDLKLLAAYASDPLDKKALSRMSSKEGKNEYKEKITDEYVGMASLIKLCPSLKIPLEHLVCVCHQMLPRYYTISSSSAVHPNSVHLTVAVTEATRSDGTKFNGVASTHLASLKPFSSQTVRIFNRPSTFRLPPNASTPIIMIGPGTGVAPMRALLQERQHQRRMDKVGRNILYFGCKRPNQDYLYEDEIAEFKSNGTLDELHVAFSRTQVEKVYVQNLLAEQGPATFDLIDKQGAYVYVCGAVKMGHDVTEALKTIVSTHGEMSFSDAKDYIAKLAAEGRYVQELWA